MTRSIKVGSSVYVWSDEWSPKHLGPVVIGDGTSARSLASLWEWCKVYVDQVDAHGNPRAEWYVRRDMGLESGLMPAKRLFGVDRAVAYWWWGGSKLSEVEARYTIFAPFYAELVSSTKAWAELVKLHGDAKLKHIYVMGSNNNAYTRSELKQLSLGEIFYAADRDLPCSQILRMMLSNKRIWEHPYDRDMVFNLKDRKLHPHPRIECIASCSLIQ